MAACRLADHKMVYRHRSGAGICSWRLESARR